MHKIVVAFYCCVFLFFSVSLRHKDARAQSSHYTLINKNATDRTRALYENLQWYKGKRIMFGHQDDLAIGVNWKHEEGSHSYYRNRVQTDSVK